MKLTLYPPYTLLAFDKTKIQLVKIEPFYVSAALQLIIHSNFTPVFRPLTESELNKVLLSQVEQDIDVRTYFNQEYFEKCGFASVKEILEHNIEWWPVGFFKLLLKYHFDVFGLLNTGKAINLTLSRSPMKTPPPTLEEGQKLYIEDHEGNVKELTISKVKKRHYDAQDADGKLYLITKGTLLVVEGEKRFIKAYTTQEELSKNRDKNEVLRLIYQATSAEALKDCTSFQKVLIMTFVVLSSIVKKNDTIDELRKLLNVIEKIGNNEELKARTSVIDEPKQPLSAEELLRPRYKVIANYPNSPYILGDIFVANYHEGGNELVSSLNPPQTIPAHYRLLYPAVFKKMKWWEDRANKELPLKVQAQDGGEIFWVKRWVGDTQKGYLTAWIEKGSEPFLLFLGNLQPTQFIPVD